MTDAPNSGTKFDRRKPCLRYIGPLLGTTCGASVGRGDYTPPSCSAPPVGGGLRPAPLARSVFLPISVGSEYLPISCRGGPMCPPGHASSRDPFTGRHTGRPLRSRSKYPSTPEERAGTEPRPYRSIAVPSGGPMYLRHGFRRPNFVPKFGASVIGIGPYERWGIRRGRKR